MSLQQITVHRLYLPKRPPSDTLSDTPIDDQLYELCRHEGDPNCPLMFPDARHPLCRRCPHYRPRCPRIDREHCMVRTRQARNSTRGPFKAFEAQHRHRTRARAAGI